MSALTTFQPDALAAALIRLRTDAHLSQRRLGELAGVSNTAISGLEAGHAPPPHPEALKKIARGLSTSGSGAIDEQRADEHYLALMRAAGYVPPETSPSVDDDAIMRRWLQSRLAPGNAELMETVVRKMAGRPAVTQEAVIRVVDVLVQSFPPDPDGPTQ